MENRSEWSPIVMEHFNNPHNVGEIEDADAFGIGGDLNCGDSMVLFIKVEKGRITNSSFLVQGCVAAIAASSMTTELVKGKKLEEAETITAEDITEALGGLPEYKLHCSVLGHDAIKDAIRRYEKKNKV